MKLLNLSGPQDFMALLVRRKWWILLPFAALSCAVVLLTYMLPKMYVSEAFIVIRPREVPTDLVRNLITGTTEERLSAIGQTVLSRTNMTQVAREFEDQLVEFRNLNMDDKVVKIRSQIGLNFNAQNAENGLGNKNLGVTYFRLSYQSRNPELAQKMARKVTELFIEEDSRARESQVSTTTQFLSDEVDKLTEELKQSDAKLKDLKTRRRYELPGQLDTNLKNLELLGRDRQALSNQLLLLNESRRQLEQKITETAQEIPKPVAAVVPQVVPVVDQKVEDYRTLQTQRRALILKGDKENHPDVQAVDRQLERLRKDMSPAELALAEKKEEKPIAAGVTAAEMMPNPAYRNLIGQLEQLKLEIKIAENQRNKADEDLQVTNVRIANEPQGEQELADLARENADLNKHYDELKNKLADSRLSESLESQQKGAQFEIVDPPNLPIKPTKPQKPVIALAGILFSLLGGIALGVGVDVANQKMWTLSDVESLLGVTVLVEIPEIVTPADVALAKKKKMMQIASVLALTAVYGVGLYYVYLHQSVVMQHLDPFIQRFYS